MRIDRPHVNFAGKVPERAARPARVRAVPVAGVPDEAPGADPACEFAGALLAARQLDPISYQTRPLVRRVPAVLRALKVTSLAEARELLARRADLLDTALNALLIGATEFFRDAEVFEELRRHVIPALGSRDGALRVWSAGCSNGAELYSVGMCLGEAGLLERASLLGTDCRPAVIEEARAGRYARRFSSSIPAELVRAYFPEHSGTRLGEARDLLRSRITWQTDDLTRSAAPGPWHLVLCRNVAIYLAAPAAAGMFDRICRSIAPGGFLIVGRAERPPVQSGLVRVNRCVYRQEGQ